jgi:hypothetical protein
MVGKKSSYERMQNWQIPPKADRAREKLVLGRSEMDL